jgi:hypothetical protein
MYDDRGLDIIADNRDTLMPIYSKFKDWILEFNYSKIEEIFSKGKMGNCLITADRIINFSCYMLEVSYYYDTK